MPQTNWEETFRIRSFEVDFRNRLHLNVLFHLMQETATNQIARQGVGVGVLRNRNEAWVLSRLLLEMDRYPGQGEEIRVETWPRGIERLFAHRDFQVTAADGEILGRATTYWLLVDLTSRRPKRLREVFEHMPTAPDRQAIIAHPEKLPPLKKPEPIMTIRVGYSRLDLNNHVNNAHYIEWVLDSFPVEIHEFLQPARLQVNFQAETKFGDRITLFKEEMDEQRAPAYGIEGWKDDGKTTAFQARLEWKAAPVLS